MRGPVEQVQRYVEGLGAQLPGLKGKTFVGAFYFATGQFAVSANRHTPRARLLGQLGMTPSPRLPPGAVNTVLSGERADLLDADMLAVGTASDELRDQLNGDPVFTRLPVVRGGRSVIVDRFAATAGNSPTMLNIPWGLDRQREVLTKVAAK